MTQTPLPLQIPRVMAGRKEEWDTDHEYGRQFLAGENPCTLTALKQMPSELCGSAIGPEYVDGAYGLGLWDLSGLCQSGRGVCSRQGQGPDRSRSGWINEL
jgi:hypothetical protein